MSVCKLYGRCVIFAICCHQELDDNLSTLTRQFEEATAAKLKCKQEAEQTAQTISLANRLVGGLAAEKVSAVIYHAGNHKEIGGHQLERGLNKSV